MKPSRKTAKLLLLLGCLLFLSGGVAAVTVGTILAPILIFGSILVNSIGIMIWRGRWF